MHRNWRVILGSRWIAAGVIGVGLLPCPDCAVPLATQIWPVAGAIWLWRRWRQRSTEQLDLVLTEDLRRRAAAPNDDPAA